MERSQSPLISVPKLDLSKVKPYDKGKKSVAQTIVPMEMAHKEKQLNTI